jgi:hypothetical protein
MNPNATAMITIEKITGCDTIPLMTTFDNAAFLAMALTTNNQNATPNPVYKYTSEVKRAKPLALDLSIVCITSSFWY